MRCEKSGQFYLIATVIIIAVVIGFAAISNYAQKQDSVKIYDLGEELSIEVENVLDYLAFNDDDKLDDFLQDYSDYAKTKDIDIYFIFGNNIEITARIYKNVAGVSLNGINLIFNDPYSEATYSNPPTQIKLAINDTEHVFELKPGENFYFIILQEIDNEKYVITN